MFIIWKNCNIDNPFLTSDVCLFNINIGWLDHPIPLDELPQGGAYINRRGSSVRSWRRRNTRNSSRSAMGKTSQGRKSLRIAVGLPEATQIFDTIRPILACWDLFGPALDVFGLRYLSFHFLSDRRSKFPAPWAPLDHRFDHRRFQLSAVWQLAKGLRWLEKDGWTEWGTHKTS